MEVREGTSGERCPFPCNLSSLLSLNCRARAEGLARRLQTQMRQNGGPSTVEGTLLVEANGKVRLAPCEGRTYSLDDYHLDAFHKASDLKNLRPIHVVTSEPTLHLSLPAQSGGVGDGSSPTEQEQDSDVYYDFDLVTPPEDYACSGETRMAAREPIPEENEKPEKPESGCVTSVTSPIMFSDKYALPPSNPPSPLEDCPPEDLNSRASDVDLEAVRQLLVSSRLRSLYTVSDTERPITVIDNHFPDFVGVVKAPMDSRTPTDEEGSSEGSSSDDVEKETQLIPNEESTAGTSSSSFYLPPPSSYQIFSNQEASYESSEMPTSPKKCKASKRRHKKRRVSSHQPQKSDSSSESSALAHETESSSGGLPEPNLSPKVKANFSGPKRDPPFKHEFCRSHSVEFWQGDKFNKLLKNSNSVEKCDFDLDTNGSRRKTSCSESKSGSVNASSNAKSSTNCREKLPNHSSIDSLSSPEEGKSELIDRGFKEQFNQPTSPKEMGQENVQSEADLGEGKKDLLLFDETEILEEIDAAISILKKSGDSVGEKLAKYENSDMKAFGIQFVEKEKKSEQVSASYVSSEIGAHDGCQEIVPDSQECVLCEEVPFNSCGGTFGRDISLDLSINDCDYPSFYDFNFPSSEVNNQSGVEDMPNSKQGRVKVKRANAEAHSPSSLGAAELPEATNGGNSPTPSFLRSKRGTETVPTSSQLSGDEINLRSDSRTQIEGEDCATPEVCCFRNGNQHADKSFLSDKVNENCSLRQNNDEESNQGNFGGKLDASSPENGSSLSHKHPANKNINSPGEESSDYQNRNGEQPNCWSLSYQQETEGDNVNGEIFPCETVNSAGREETCNSLTETFHTKETARKDPLRGTRRKLKTKAFSAEQGPSSCFHKNVALNSIRSLSEDKSSGDDPELKKTCISLLGLSYSEQKGNENSKDTRTSPTSDTVSGSIEEPNRSCTNPSKEEEDASLEGEPLPPVPAKYSFDEDTDPMISDVTSPVKHNDSSEADEGKQSPGESEKVCSTKMEVSSDSSSSPVVSDGHEKQLEKVGPPEPEAETTKPLETEIVSDEEIETLPESEISASKGTEEEEEEDSDEEIVISGRFRNISKYTERVSSLSEDDGLPPPPTEVILVDYNEPLDPPPEDTGENKDIGPDLASELTRLSCDEPSVEPPSDDSQRSSEERDTEQDLQTRIKRSSSLRCGKTPPGTPGRKKIVRFADCLGLDLADIRTFLDGIPTVPPSAFCDLQVDDDHPGPDSAGSTPQGGVPTYGSYSAAASAAAAVLQNQARRILTPMFQQPGGLPDFFSRLREQKVVLENVSVGTDLSVKGVVRVVNEAFHKKVFIRYTFDHWRNYHEATASYVDGSSDGFSDRFSFLLWGSFLQSNGSLVFCVKYCVNDKQYWDNNRGSNYVLQCYSAPPIPIPNAEIRPLDGRPQNNHSIENNERHRHGHSHGHDHGGAGGSSGHYSSSSFADTPLTPTDPWMTRFF